MINLRQSIKLIGVTVLAFCAVFVCTIFVNYSIDIKSIAGLITDPQTLALYDAKLIMSKFIIACCGGILGLVTLLVLLFAIGGYINENQANMGILKALGHSETKIALSFSKFGLSVLIGTGLGYAGGFLVSPAFYGILDSANDLPEVVRGFHFEVMLMLVIIPAIVFTAVSVFYALAKLRKPPLEMIKEETRTARKHRMREGLATKDIQSIKEETRTARKRRLREGLATKGIQSIKEETRTARKHRMREGMATKDIQSIKEETRTARKHRMREGMATKDIQSIKKETRTARKHRMRGGMATKGIQSMDNAGEVKAGRSAKRLNISNEKLFLKNLRRTLLFNNLLLIFFVAFAALTFSCMTQMSFSMSKLNADTSFAVMLTLIGFIIGAVTLLIALGFVINSNRKYLAFMKACGYTDGECNRAMFGGFRIVSYIGFAIGTGYQFFLVKIIASIFTAAYENAPEISFNFLAFFITLGVFIVAYEIIMILYKQKIKKIPLKEIMQG